LNDHPVVWITGAKGLIGNELVRSANQFAPEFKARGLSRADADLLDFSAVEALFQKERPQQIIHCAALSNNVICEGEPALAQEQNVDVTRKLLELASYIPFLFFSTDLIFDGSKGNYVEEDAPNPLSVYGRTKVAAEELVRAHPQHAIVRISITGGHSPRGNRGFNEEMKNAWRAGKALNLFVDEYRCASTADVIARGVWDLVKKNARGTFHLCGAERLSRYRIGELMAAKHPELNPKINGTSRNEYRGAPRPPDTSMDCTKAQGLLSFEIPRFSDWLARDTTGF
jgi:dTDP-4-dehydrorhamnose reductase